MNTTGHRANVASTPKTGLFALLRGLALALAAALACSGALAAPTLAAEGACPNEQLRAETGSTRLPDCRAYEMVSPLFKGGYGVQGIEAVALDGEGVAYYSPGAFAGQPTGFSEALDRVDYLARRGAGGWSTAPLIPPAELAPEVLGDADVSPTLESELEQVRFANLESSRIGNRVEFGLHSTAAPDTKGEWEPAGGLLLENITSSYLVLNYQGADTDFCHILFSNPNADAADPSFWNEQALVPAAKGVFNPLYELNRGCGGESAGVRLVAVNNDGEGRAINPSCLVGLGYAVGEQDSQFNAIADDGSEVFFSACTANSEADREADHQVFVRVAGTRTLEVSKPVLPACVEVPCAGASGRAEAEFIGASEDGSRVFFTAPLASGQSPLVPGDTDSSNNLYLANIGCPEAAPECGVSERVVTSLVAASHDPSAGGAAEVQGVVRVAPDGSRVYFVARGVLSEEPNAQGALPAKGADNLYVYDSVSGKVVYIADLCSGSALSGTVSDSRCPLELSERRSPGVAVSKAQYERELWASNIPNAQTAGAQGQFLVFSTYARLVANDTDDALGMCTVMTLKRGRLNVCLLVKAGFDANGNQDDAPGEANGGRDDRPR